MGRAYDAREVYLADKGDGPPSRWRLAAILQGLIETVSSEPPPDTALASERRARIDELIRLAEGRGLDFDSHILPHLRRVAFEAVFKKLVRTSGSERPPQNGRSAEWALIADEYLEKTAGTKSREALGKAYEALLRPVMSWATTADATDLFDWTPPQRPLIEMPSAVAAESNADGQWIVDRFTKTYLADWSTGSLRKEWMYVHGQYKPPCLSLEMKVREVPETELALEMADRMARSTNRRPPLAPALVEPAAEFLREGRRVEAAALFEAALHHEPDSPDALNNLGFCLLPDHPDQALALFERALATRRGDTEVFNANRMLALVALGRRTSASDLASAYLQGDPPVRASFAWLWDIESILNDGNEPMIAKFHDLKPYAEEILTVVSNSRSKADGSDRGAAGKP